MSESFGNNIIAKLQAKGADKSSAWLIKSTVHEINIDKNELSMFRTIVNNRLSMKIIKNNRVATAGINDLAEKSVDEAINSMFESMEASLPDSAHDVAPADGTVNNFAHNPNNPTQEQMVIKVNNLLKQIQSDYPKIIVGESNLAFHHEEQEIYNSNGLENSSENNYFLLVLGITAKDGKKTSSCNYCFKGYRGLDDVDNFLDNPDFNRLLTQVSEQTDNQGLADKFVGDIIITPECLSQTIWMLLSPVFEHQIIAKTSIYLDKLNQMIAAPNFTVKALPQSKEFAAISFLTNDGFITQNENIIENGVLKTFILSLYGANKTGFARSLSGAENMVVEAGNLSIKQMVKNCKKGVLLCRFSGGEPSDNGDFSGIAKNSYYIENGEIKYPLSETMITGNTAEMLKNITEISQEVVNDGFSQMPYLKVSGLNISGAKAADEARAVEGISLI